MSKKRRKNNINPRNPSVVPASYEPVKQATDAYRKGQAEISRIDKRLKDSVPAGFQFDWLNTVHYNNIVYPIDKIPDRLLRLVERRNPIVGAAITLRIQELALRHGVRP